MWCPNCKSDAQAVSSASGPRCRDCNGPLPGPTRSTTTLRDARDIIAKWSSSDLMDQISSLPDMLAMPEPRIPVLEPSISDSASGAQPVTELPDVESPVTEVSQVPKPVPDKPKPQTPVAAPQRQLVAEAAEQSQPEQQGQDAAWPHEKSTLQHTPSEVQPEIAAVKPEVDDTTDIRPIILQSAVTVAQRPDVSESPVKPPKMNFAEPKVTEKQIESPSAAHIESKLEDELRNRRLQERNLQRRQKRDRKAPAQAESKGSIPVKRKLRVDTLEASSALPEEAPAVDVDSSRNVAGGRIQSNSPKGGRRHRIDSGEPVEETLSTADSRTRTHGRPRQRYIDEPHATAIRGPHFEVTAPRRSNLTAMTGQFLAYLGVLGLTVGTAMVIYGHFGGHSQYTPTGWLVTTVAQMMLFLGVINLVSGGMEQTNEDVSTRINSLGEQLMRIEQVAEEAMRGPKIDPRRYADPDGYVEESQREVVGTRERH